MKNVHVSRPNEGVKTASQETGNHLTQKMFEAEAPHLTAATPKEAAKQEAATQETKRVFAFIPFEDYVTLRNHCTSTGQVYSHFVSKIIVDYVEKLRNSEH